MLIAHCHLLSLLAPRALLVAHGSLPPVVAHCSPLIAHRWQALSEAERERHLRTERTQRQVTPAGPPSTNGVPPRAARLAALTVTVEGRSALRPRFDPLITEYTVGDIFIIIKHV
jgi:hypothetical protein